MAKKQDSFYFENFSACAEHACAAAKLLDEALRNFQPDHLKDKLDVIHAEEHAADLKKHDLMNTLVRAFITPIEREDIILMSQNIDDMVDTIEDVLMRMYCNNVRSIRPDALDLVKVLVDCTQAVKALLDEFENFKRSKTINELIVKINTLEEEGDKLFIKCLRDLHTTSTDAVEIMVWHEMYTYLEYCCDACEHVADTVETVIMKNT